VRACDAGELEARLAALRRLTLRDDEEAELWQSIGAKLSAHMHELRRIASPGDARALPCGRAAEEPDGHVLRRLHAAQHPSAAPATAEAEATLDDFLQSLLPAPRTASECSAAEGARALVELAREQEEPINAHVRSMAAEKATLVVALEQAGAAVPFAALGIRLSRSALLRLTYPRACAQLHYSR
jgi:hypothetical protein